MLKGEFYLPQPVSLDTMDLETRYPAASEPRQPAGVAYLFNLFGPQEGRNRGNRRKPRQIGGSEEQPASTMRGRGRKHRTGHEEKLEEHRIQRETIQVKKETAQKRRQQQQLNENEQKSSVQKKAKIEQSKVIHPRGWRRGVPGGYNGPQGKVPDYNAPDNAPHKGTPGHWRNWRG